MTEKQKGVAFEAASEPHIVPRDMKSRIFSETKDHDVRRQLSMAADSNVTNFIGGKMSSATTVIFMLNSLTGLSLLTLPYGFSQCGLVLGALILFLCMTMAYITATFMCEALTIANALQYETAEVTYVESNKPLMAKLSAEHKEAMKSNPELCRHVTSDGSSAVHGSPSEPLLGKRATVADFVDEMRSANPLSEFKIRERVELGPMGEMVLTTRNAKIMAAGIYIMILSFTYGTATALVVTVNVTLGNVYCSAVSLLGGGACDTPEGISKDLAYHLSVAVSFCVTLPLCFADVQKTKKVYSGHHGLSIYSNLFLALRVQLEICRTFSRRRSSRSPRRAALVEA